MTTPEDWESEAYREARRDRSAVESLNPLTHSKDGFRLWRTYGRRGIDIGQAMNCSEKVKILCLQLLLGDHTDEETAVVGGTPRVSAA